MDSTTLILSPRFSIINCLIPVIIAIRFFKIPNCEVPYFKKLHFS